MLPFSGYEALQEKSSDKWGGIKQEIIEEDVIAPGKFVRFFLQERVKVIEVNPNTRKNHNGQEQNRRELVFVELFKIRDDFFQTAFI